jgi:hypothetical protein
MAKGFKKPIPKEKTVLPVDGVEIEWTENEKNVFKKAGDTEIVHREQALKFVAKGFATMVEDGETEKMARTTESL